MQRCKAKLKSYINESCHDESRTIDVAYSSLNGFY